MKAILKFKDGTDRLATVPSSEDEAGDVYVLEHYTFKNVQFKLVEIHTSGKLQWAEYQEIENPSRGLTLVKSG